MKLHAHSDTQADAHSKIKQKEKNFTVHRSGNFSSGASTRIIKCTQWCKNQSGRQHDWRAPSARTIAGMFGIFCEPWSKTNKYIKSHFQLKHSSVVSPEGYGALTAALFKTWQATAEAQVLLCLELKWWLNSPLPAANSYCVTHLCHNWSLWVYLIKNIDRIEINWILSILHKAF